MIVGLSTVSVLRLNWSIPLFFSVPPLRSARPSRPLGDDHLISYPFLIDSEHVQLLQPLT